MPTKAQHQPHYRPLPAFLRQLREEADLAQRDLAQLLKKPQSWVHNCETGTRRVDVGEFVMWARACDVAPKLAFNRYVRLMDGR